jgi:hypothetical protein
VQLLARPTSFFQLGVGVVRRRARVVGTFITTGFAFALTSDVDED